MQFYKMFILVALYMGWRDADPQYLVPDSYLFGDQKNKPGMRIPMRIPVSSQKNVEIREWISENGFPGKDEDS